MTIDRCKSVEETAEFFSVDKRTIYREIERGNLEAVKVGTALRIPIEAIERYMKGRMAHA